MPTIKVDFRLVLLLCFDDHIAHACAFTLVFGGRLLRGGFSLKNNCEDGSCIYAVNFEVCRYASLLFAEERASAPSLGSYRQAGFGRLVPRVVGAIRWH